MRRIEAFEMLSAKNTKIAEAAADADARKVAQRRPEPGDAAVPTAGEDWVRRYLPVANSPHSATA
jgi:hypothetical protein